jgi:hypothetical protein
MSRARSARRMEPWEACVSLCEPAERATLVAEHVRSESRPLRGLQGLYEVFPGFHSRCAQRATLISTLGYKKPPAPRAVWVRAPPARMRSGAPAGCGCSSSTHSPQSIAPRAVGARAPPVCPRNTAPRAVWARLRPYARGAPLRGLWVLELHPPARDAVLRGLCVREVHPPAREALLRGLCARGPSACTRSTAPRSVCARGPRPHSAATSQNTLIAPRAVVRCSKSCS